MPWTLGIAADLSQLSQSRGILCLSAVTFNVTLMPGQQSSLATLRFDRTVVQNEKTGIGLIQTISSQIFWTW